MQNSPKDLYKKLLGRQGEQLVCKYLKKNGYKILEKNYVCKFGEADLICQKDDNIVFVEVKTRTNVRYGMPSEAVGYAKQKKYKEIATYYCLIYKIQDKNVTFSVAEVLNGEINLISEAF